MNNKIKIIYIFVLIFILVLLLYKLNFFHITPEKKYINTATVGIITDKKNGDNYTVTLLKFGESYDKIEKIKIIVEDENVWNLIEINRSYFVNYSQGNEDLPVLNQIIINDQFKEIYGNYFGIK